MRRSTFCRAALCVAAMSSSQAAHTQSENLALDLRSGRAQLTADDDGRLTANETATWDNHAGNRYGLIALERYPSNSDMTTLAEMGITVLEFIPKRAYLVGITANANLSALDAFVVKGHSAMLPSFKKAFHQSSAPAHAIQGTSILVNVHPYGGIDPASARAMLARLGFACFDDDFSANALIVACSATDIDPLCALPFVHFVDWRYKAGEPENHSGRTLHRINYIANPTTNGLGYSGSGIGVMLQDDGMVGPHIDFTGRLAHYWETNTGDHGDHCGGIICGAGNINPFTEGQAKGVDMSVYKAAPQYTGFDSIETHYVTKGIVITSTSYSNGCNSGYTSFTRRMDEQSYDIGGLMHVFSAGNDGTSDCGYGAGNAWGNITGGHKMGKNVITVGNLSELDVLAASSSRGPATDGRIKPDLCAKGTNVLSTVELNTYDTKSGTSMACPGVAGSLAVLYEAFKDKHGTLPDGGLMKALVLNTADDLGNTGPDFKHGWGRINVRKAFEAISDTAFLTGNLSDGDSVAFSLAMPPNTAKARFMVYWTDPEAAVNATTALVNDLDLRVSPPAGNVLLPYLLDHTANVTALNTPATTGADHLNNMEQVEIANPATGSYTVKIKGHNVPFGPQEYFLVYWFEPQTITLTHPVGGEAFVPFTQELIRWDSPYLSGTVLVEYSDNGGASWNTISGTTPVAQGYVAWTPPQMAKGNVRVRLTYNAQTVVSGDFTVIERPSGLDFLFSCPDSIGLKWNPVSQATGYIIYRLGPKYMEPIGTSNTAYFVDYTAFALAQNLWYSVAATGPNNALGKRMNAVQKNPGVFDCIINTDARLTAVSPPAGSYHACYGDSLTLSFTVDNLAVNAIDSFTIAVTSASGQAFSQTFFSTINPGSSQTVVLGQKLARTQTGDTMQANVNVYLDGNPYNDTLIAIYHYPAGAMHLPNFREDFEEFDTCSTAPTCGAVTCALTGGWFNEQNEQIDDMDWRVSSGATPSESTGPDTDHTTGTASGKYLYLEASDCFMKTAALTSPCIDLRQATAPTLSFWCHMIGSTVGSLILDVFDGQTWTLGVFALNGQQAAGWNLSEVDLSAFAGKVINVRFRGITGNGFQSDIALDDIGIAHPPVAKFTYEVEEDGLTVAFTDHSLYADSTVFETGDETTYAHVPAHHTYAEVSAYLVSQHVFNDAGSDSYLEIISGLGIVGESEDVAVLFPNPARETVGLRGADLRNIEILNATGQVVTRVTASGQSETRLDISALKAGLYVVRINGEKALPLAVMK